jgi:hypothetical protein
MSRLTTFSKLLITAVIIAVVNFGASYFFHKTGLLTKK